MLLSSGRLAFDFGTLLACIRATGVKPNPSLVLLAYAVAGLLALIPITPGGLGIVEAGLSALLILAGVPGVDAVVATLAYRIISYWLPIFVGPFAYLAFRLRYGKPGSAGGGGAGRRRGSGIGRGLRSLGVLRAGEGCPMYEGTWESAADPPGARLVRRRQARHLHPLGPLLGPGLGAAGARHSAAARQGRPQADAAREPLRRVVPQHHADQGQPDGRSTTRTVYGEDYPYDNFVRTFDDASSGADLDAIAALCQDAGRPLRRAHHQAPRRLRPVALLRAAPGQGRVPGAPRPGG